MSSGEEFDDESSDDNQSFEGDEDDDEDTEEEEEEEQSNAETHENEGGGDGVEGEEEEVEGEGEDQSEDFEEGEENEEQLGGEEEGGGGEDEYGGDGGDGGPSAPFEYEQQQEPGLWGENEAREEQPERLATLERTEAAGGQEAAFPSFDGLVKGALDGFGSGSVGDIIGKITSMSGGEGGITNALASGSFGALAGQLIASAAHQFLGINPETGRIIGAIAGNLIFGLGGRDNSLSGIGKLVLDQLVSGRFQRPVQPFVPPRGDLPSFNLNFHAERERCLRERRLFEDPEFGASDQSLYFSKRPPKSVEWKRPGELFAEPQLLVEQRASRFDVVQGQLGDCWLLAAAAGLTLREELFFRVVPPDQSFVENYAGIFHFQFWRYGQWVDVVIDDRLPTHNDELLYMHSANGQSFWSALLEKAYAKLYGSYEALKGGTTSEALEDFTGGLIEHFDLEEMHREQLLAVLVRGFQMGSFFGCSIDADPNVTEARLDNGLVMGHAYSITALQTVSGRNGETVLLRVRNPWGEHEWNGAWSDGSAEWNYISEADRQRMHISFAEDGEFWMELGDFHREFQRMECCNLGPEVLDEICQMMDLKEQQQQQQQSLAVSQQQHKWSQFATHGEWSIAKGTAGGCRNYSTFCNNPQYGTLVSVLSGSSSPEQDGKCTMICAVLQKYRRELRSVGLDDLPIGFAVYPLANQKTTMEEQVEPIFLSGSNNSSNNNNYYSTRNLGYGPGYGGHSYGSAYASPPQYPPTTTTFSRQQQPSKLQRLDQEQLNEGAKTVAKSASFVNLREVTARFRLLPGQYVIVPSTFEPDQEGQFLLRAFCSGQFQALEL